MKTRKHSELIKTKTARYFEFLEWLSEHIDDGEIILLNKAGSQYGDSARDDIVMNLNIVARDLEGMVIDNDQGDENDNS